jgi:predicted DNA binding CopG/RHH family protein
MKKRLPKLKNDKDVRKLLARDLTEYLNADNLAALTFEFAPKSKVVNLRMSEGLYQAVQEASQRQGVPYQKYIRQALEESLRRGQAKR